MQCTCGGVADTEVKVFASVDQHEEACKYLVDRKPEKYPCVTHYSKCDSCGRASKHITYRLNGILSDGKVIQGFTKAPKSKSSRRLF